MYLEHFGLTEFPFGLTPNTQFYCDLPSHTDALNVLLLSLNNGEGFLKITGNVGTGKTMLCRKLLNQLETPYITAYIPNPQLTANGLYIAIAQELGITLSNDEPSSLLHKINQYLLNACFNNQKPVLIIDEAQAMPIETLEALRLISNLETEKQKLFQIILFGQPELDDLLQKKAIRQLRQRICFSYCLKTLSTQDVNDYITHRLKIANSNNPAVFSKSANNALHFYSQGIPRLINILAHKALLSAYGKGSTTVGIKQVKHAARDTEDSKQHLYPFEYSKRLVFALILGFSLFVTSSLYFNHSNQSIFQMSLLNQVLQDLEKRNPDQIPEQYHSANTNHISSSNHKLLYIPLVLICISGIFVYIKSRSHDSDYVIAETNNQQNVPYDLPEQKIITNTLDTDKHALPTQNDQDITLDEYDLNPTLSKEKENLQANTNSNNNKKDSQIAEKLFKTAKNQQNPVDKQLTLDLALEQNPEHIDARLLLANILFDQGLANEAEKILDLGIEILPENQKLIKLRKHLSRQNELSEQKQNTAHMNKVNYKTETNSSSKKQLTATKTTKPATENNKIKSKKLGNKQKAQQLLDSAEKIESLAEKQNILEQVVNLNPQLIKARLLLAHTQFNQDKIDQAEQLLDQSLTIFPQNLKFINLRSQLFLHKNQPQAALNTLLKIDSESVTDETYLSFLAAAYQKIHDNFNSMRIYQKLISLNPEKAEYWLGLAIAYDKNGINQQAHDSYQQALVKNPLKDEIVSYIKERIDILK